MASRSPTAAPAAAIHRHKDPPRTVPAENLDYVAVPGRFLARQRCRRTMPGQKDQSATVERQLQVLDVSIVDVLSHLEALLRQCHTIQRKLLQLRSEAPPPRPALPDLTLGALHRHTEEMRAEWAMLGEIIGDLTVSICRLSDEHCNQRRGGFDRRRALE
jgi:hypothetical protein